MDNYSVTVEGLDDLLKRLDLVSPLKDGMTAASIYVVKKMKYYPKNESRPQPFKTDKSRRWFFANLKSGNISVPYKRTMGLRNHWTYQVSTNGEVSQIGNNVPYAQIVQGRDKQSAYHKETGWATAEDTLDNERDEISKIVAIPINEYLNTVQR